jgi:hypothetical protein
VLAGLSKASTSGEDFMTIYSTPRSVLLAAAVVSVFTVGAAALPRLPARRFRLVRP